MTIKEYTIYKFNEFLEKHNAFEEFHSLYDSYLESLTGQANRFIIMGLSWERSSSGGDYWCKLNELWLEEINK